MRADIDRWDAKYAAREPSAALEPDPLLLEYRHLLPTSGLCIDIAGGTGDNGLFLGQLGCDMLIVDGSETGLRLCRRKAEHHGLHPNLVAADLDRFELPRSTFDVVLVFRYLNRALIPALRDCLKTNGLLVYKTFNLRHRIKHPGFNPDYLLQDGELNRWFGDMRCLATNESDERATTSYWIGCRA